MDYLHTSSNKPLLNKKTGMSTNVKIFDCKIPIA